MNITFIVRKGFDGAYYVYMIGDGSYQNPTDCTGGTTNNYTKTEYVKSGVYVTRGETIHGPWSPVQQLEFDTSDLLCGGHTNPSPHFNPDGSVHLAFQAQPCEAQNEFHSWAMIGLARAANWNGPYTLVSPDPITAHNYSVIHPACVAGTDEDPFLWRSERGFHVLTHGMCPSGLRQGWLMMFIVSCNLVYFSLLAYLYIASLLTLI